MTLAAKIIFIAALTLSIILPFSYFLLGERCKKRYKRTLGVNTVFFFGTLLVAMAVMFSGQSVEAAETTAANAAGIATGLGYLAAALVTGLSCIGYETHALHEQVVSPFAVYVLKIISTTLLGMGLFIFLEFLIEFWLRRKEAQK